MIWQEAPAREGEGPLFCTAGQNNKYIHIYFLLNLNYIYGFCVQLYAQ